MNKTYSGVATIIAVKNAFKYKLLVKKHLLNKQVTDCVQDFIYYWSDF